MNKHLITLAMAGILVTACSNQHPAPVVSGYESKVYGQSAKTETLQAPTGSYRDYSNVEPAAGPASPKVEDLSPAKAPVSAPKATLPPPSIIGDLKHPNNTQNGWRSYEVQKGDTLYRVAREFNTTPQEIMTANRLDAATEIQVGKQLMIPAGSRDTGKAKAETQTATVETEAPAAEQSAATPKQPTVVQGPSGTRYSLTRKQQTTIATADNKLAAIEPAAGPSNAKVSANVKSSGGIRTHKVKAGETVYRIAQMYDASVFDIMNANDFEKPQDLKAGTIVRVPVAGDGGEVSDPFASYRGQVDPNAAAAKGYVWPVKGKVVQNFGDAGNGVNHTGINIQVPVNSPVMAAEEGTVVYADDALKTYGNLVLLRHPGGTVTAYAHNNALLVVKGEKVKKGQVIALSGNSGNATKPQLHFEVRKNARAIDPLAVLPK